uniref:Odorant receptor n=1 Tax=Calliphora stygia TaxID=145453 RepID=A0A068F7J8_CALSG|nr:odorant receptor [Calliphora stygia]
MVLDKTIPHIGKFFAIPLNLFFILGFCIIRWKPNEKPKELQYLFILFLVFNSVYNVAGMLSYTIYEPLETSLEKTAYIIYTTFAGNSVMKFVCCLCNLKKLHQCFKSLEKYYPRTAKEREDYRLDEHLKKMERFNLLLTIYHFLVTSIFSWFPLIQSTVLYYKNEERSFPYMLPFPMHYIFNERTNLGYAFAYTTQCTGSYAASCMCQGADILLLTCVHLINMNLTHLAKTIRDFKPTGTLSDLKQLKQFVTYHNDILSTVNLIDDTFSLSILLNYLCTVTIMCLIGFQMVIGTNIFHLLKFLLFFMSVLTPVYFISKFGTDMMELSSDINEAFMHHSWYDGHILYQRSLIMSIRISQKPVHLNAFKFFIISMETFKSLISISYQFFTMIKTSYVEE